MKTHTFSIVVGTGACNACCPFCISKMTCRAIKKHTVNWNRFETACRIVEQARDGVINVILTGTGEPTLYSNDIVTYLEAMNRHFPLVTLQTNGILLNEVDLTKWRDKGLTQVCISITSESGPRNNEIMGVKNDDFNFWQRVQLVHNVGLSVRLNCTMLREGISLPEHVEELIDCCKENHVEQLTFREVDRPANPAAARDVNAYVDREKPTGAAKKLFHYLSMNGANRLLNLPHGGVVFDYRDQNICISNCFTDTFDPNNIRQIIFYPNGEIGYDWQFKGARIL